MCGRFALDTAEELIEAHYSCSCRSEALTNYNITPEADVAAVVMSRKTGKREAHTFRWGFAAATMAKSRPLFNARIETAAEKPSFRHSLRNRRCIIPASAFYEWCRETRVPYMVKPLERFLSFAGLWNVHRDGEGTPQVRCTILTTKATPPLAKIHERCPAVLDPADFAQWLDPDLDETSRLLSLPHAIRNGEAELGRASPKVNKPSNNDPSLLERPD